MNTLRGFGFLAGWGRRLALAAAVLLILGPVGFSISQSGGQEDALLLIQKHGTAGMRLQGGKSIEVRDNKLYVRSGQTVRALFADKAQFFVGRNASKLGTADIRRLALEAVQDKLAAQFNQSYKVHSTYELRGEAAGRKTVLARFVFEYKNIWYAEERALELEVVSRGTAHTLASSRLVAAPPLKISPPIKGGAEAGRVTTRPPLGAQSAQNLAQAKRDKYQLATATTLKISAKYREFRAAPIYEIAKEFGGVISALMPKGLANTAYPEVVTAEEATNQVQIIMQTALGTARKLVGAAESSRDNVLNYLKTDTNLVAWNNIGHGNTATIFQNGTNIGAADFAPAGDFRGLSGCVCLVNSCQTFNDPLKAAILACAPRVYIAGVINLPMVTSEGSNPNFWWKTLIEHKAMSVAYSETNTASGLNGYWGFWGDNGIF
jgi:hypothetical protein